ncbi:hypothetical protein [Bradyrhizobium sp. SEMIA]|uniref:hypothetical protein n=1 Tax=Bradyrhizobium sp. SEMIA TaxID=2597515 RepID=UPI0018A34D6B|nr:hypothetical protein [Bradyrhizobium sp. SEMIA]QOG22223.1 hypothetical protein FOM02_37945 [Bradyrhizobium sp. SEMIA]
MRARDNTVPIEVDCPQKYRGAAASPWRCLDKSSKFHLPVGQSPVSKKWPPGESGYYPGAANGRIAEVSAYPFAEHVAEDRAGLRDFAIGFTAWLHADADAPKKW